MKQQSSMPIDMHFVALTRATINSNTVNWRQLDAEAGKKTGQVDGGHIGIEKTGLEAKRAKVQEDKKVSNCCSRDCRGCDVHNRNNDWTGLAVDVKVANRKCAHQGCARG